MFPASCWSWPTVTSSTSRTKGGACSSCHNCAPACGGFEIASRKPSLNSVGSRVRWPGVLLPSGFQPCRSHQHAHLLQASAWAPLDFMPQFPGPCALCLIAQQHMLYHRCRCVWWNGPYKVKCMTSNRIGASMISWPLLGVYQGRTQCADVSFVLVCRMMDTGLLSPELQLQIAEHCALGLQHMHSMGYCHLDVKSENILLFIPETGTSVPRLPTLAWPPLATAPPAEWTLTILSGESAIRTCANCASGVSRPMEHPSN